MPVHGPDDGCQEHKETGVGPGILAGIQQIDAGIGGQRPIDVLAGAVDARERLFVEQGRKAMALGHLAQRLHDQLVVIGREVGGGVHGSQFELIRGYLLVLGLGRDAQAPQLVIELTHESGHALGYLAVVMILHLLAFGRGTTEQRPVGQLQVGAPVIQPLLHQKVFLLRSDGRHHAAGAILAQGLEHADGGRADGIDRAEQRNLLVQRLAVVRYEGCGYVECQPGHVILEKRGAGRIPGRIATGLEGGAEPAGREA